MDLFLSDICKKTEDYAIKHLGFPSIVLMEHAAKGVLEEIKLRFNNFSSLNFLVLYGSGNNGGDALALARMLLLEKAKITIVEAVAPPKTIDAVLEMDLLKASGEFLNDKIEFINVLDIDDYICNNTIVIDGIFGTGLKQELSIDLKNLFKKINKAKFIISIDVPSGVNPDNGCINDTAICADLTVTFMFPKLGLYVSPGSLYSGEVVVKQLMIPVLEQSTNSIYVTKNLVLNILSRYPRVLDSHKGCFGHVGIFASQKGMEGAVALCAEAVLKSGAGLVSVIAIDENTDSIRSRMPMLCKEAMIYSIDTKQEINLSKFDCLVIGPGFGKDKIKFLKKLLQKLNKPIVIDADAINIISENKELMEYIKNNNVILTPHPGEMSRLTNLKNVQKNRLDIVKNFSNNNLFTLLLKGYRSLLYSNENKVYINSSGNSALAKGGNGDVLSGVIAAFVAQGFLNWQACVVAMYIHGLCADELIKTFSDFSITPSDIINKISDVLICMKKE